MLLFVVDGSGFDGNEPATTLKNLLAELRMYDKKLLKKPGLVFANKSDIKCSLYAYGHLKLTDFCSTKKELGGAGRGSSSPWYACDHRKVYYMCIYHALTYMRLVD